MKQKLTFKNLRHTLGWLLCLATFLVISQGASAYSISKGVKLYFADKGDWGTVQLYISKSDYKTYYDFTKIDNTKIFYYNFSGGWDGYAFIKFRSNTSWTHQGDGSITQSFSSNTWFTYSDYGSSCGHSTMANLNGTANLVLMVSEDGSSYSESTNTSCVAQVSGYNLAAGGTSTTEVNASTGSSSTVSISAAYGSTITYSLTSATGYTFKGFSTTNSSSLPSDVTTSTTTQTATGLNGSSCTTYYAYFAKTKYYVAGNGTTGSSWCDGKSWDVQGSLMSGSPASVTFSNVSASSDGLLFKVTTGAWSQSGGTEFAYGAYSTSSPTSLSSHATVSNGGTGDGGNIKIVTTAVQNITIYCDGKNVFIKTEDVCTTPKASDFTVSGMTTTYTGSEQAPSITPASGMGTVTVKYDGTAGTGKTDAGTYAVTVDVAASDTYCAATGIGLGNFKIDKAQRTISITNTTTTFCETETPTITYSLSAEPTVGTITYHDAGDGTATASVDLNTGKITCESPGTVNVQVKTTTGTNYKAAESAVTTFKFDATSVAGTVTPDASSVCSGSGTTLRISGNTGSTYQWQSSDSESGTYSDIQDATSATYATGNLTATTYYKVKVTNGTCSADVSDAATVSVKAIAAAAQYTLSNYTKTYGSVTPPTITPATGAGTVETVYYEGTSGTSYAKSSTLPTNVGTYKVYVDVNDGTTYCGATGIELSGTFTINKADQAALTFNGSTQYLGTEVTLSASGGSSGQTITYAKKSGSGTVSGTKLTASAAGDVVVTATRPGGTNYNDVTADATFTFNALPNVSSQTATESSTSQIDLSWTKDATYTTVMIVRYSGDSPTVTAPTNGTSYSVNDAIGDGTVIYKGTDQSKSDTGLSASTTYKYYFYTVNNNYYSDGVNASATTYKEAPAGLYIKGPLVDADWGSYTQENVGYSKNNNVYTFSFNATNEGDGGTTDPRHFCISTTTDDNGKIHSLMDATRTGWSYATSLTSSNFVASSDIVTSTSVPIIITITYNAANDDYTMTLVENCQTPTAGFAATGQLNAGQGSPWEGTKGATVDDGQFANSYRTITLTTDQYAKYYEWTCLSTPGTAATATLSNSTSQTATAEVNLPGTYTFNVKAKCSSDASYVTSSTVTVTVPYPLMGGTGYIFTGGWSHPDAKYHQFTKDNVTTEGYVHYYKTFDVDTNGEFAIIQQYKLGCIGTVEGWCGWTDYECGSEKGNKINSSTLTSHKGIGWTGSGQNFTTDCSCSAGDEVTIEVLMTDYDTYTLKMYKGTLCTEDPTAGFAATAVYNNDESPWKDTFADEHRSAVLSTSVPGVYQWYGCNSDGSGETTTPTNVTLSNATSASCTATFNLPGTYYFKVKAGCTTATVSSQVVTVNVPYPEMGFNGPLVTNGSWTCHCDASTAYPLTQTPNSPIWTGTFTVTNPTDEFIVIQRYKNNCQTSPTCGTCPGWAAYTECGADSDSKSQGNNKITFSVSNSDLTGLEKSNNNFKSNLSGLTAGESVTITVTMTGYNSYTIVMSRSCTPPTASDFTYSCSTAKTYTGSAQPMNVTWKSGTGSGAITPYYKSGDGEYSSDDPVNAGTYTVAVSTVAADGYCAANKLVLCDNNYTIAKASRTIAVQFDKSAVCKGGEITLSNTTVGDGTVTYAIIDADKSKGSINGNILTCTTANTTIGVTATISGGTNYADATSTQANATVYADPETGTLSANPTSICKGETSVVSTNSVEGISSYQWKSSSTEAGEYTNVSGGSGETTKDYTTGALNATTYYKVQVTNSNGCSALSASPVSVTVKSASLSIDASTSTVNPYTAVTLTANNNSSEATAANWTVTGTGSYLENTSHVPYTTAPSGVSSVILKPAASVSTTVTATATVDECEVTDTYSVTPTADTQNCQ